MRESEYSAFQCMSRVAIIWRTLLVYYGTYEWHKNEKEKKRILGCDAFRVGVHSHNAVLGSDVPGRYFGLWGVYSAHRLIL